METERASPRYSDIDLWEPGDILHALIEGQMAAVAAVRPALGAIERAAAATETRLRGDGRLIYVGAGTSGRLAVQDGAELIPTFNWPQDRLLLLMAGGEDALLRTAEGAEDEIERAARLIQQHRIGAADVIIAVAASGTTPFTLACMREAKRRDALAIGIANNKSTPLLDEAECPIWLDTGPEPIAGSTRMKAGTAQRVALNLLSTLVMIRLGRVHEGLMVDVQAVNAKLVERSVNILRRLSGRSVTEVNDALARGGNIKIAMLLLHGCGNAQAESLLKQAGGRLRTALRLAGVQPAIPFDMLTVEAEDASAVSDKLGRSEDRRRDPAAALSIDNCNIDASGNVIHCLASAPKDVSSHWPKTQMNEPQSEPISRHLRDAFYGAVQLYPNWTAFGHGPLVSVDGRRYRISDVCNLAIEISDGMPDDLIGSLMFLLNAGDQDLLEGLAKDRSYASGARCLLKLMYRRSADSRTLEESRRNG